MLSAYFKAKTSTEEFTKDITSILEEIKDKKILIYGAGKAFTELNKVYKLTGSLNISAIADIKFKFNKTGKFLNIKAIEPENIPSEEFDIVLITNECSSPIVNYLKNNIQIKDTKIRVLFNEKIKDERINILYLYKNKFDKTLPKLIKKLKNKKVILYGAGVYFEAIRKYFDLSGLNIIAITDKKFSSCYNTEEKYSDCNICTIQNIIGLNPDYVLISTKNYIGIYEYLTENLLKNTKIKVKPLVKKSFITLLKEAWGF